MDVPHSFQVKAATYSWHSHVSLRSYNISRIDVLESASSAQVPYPMENMTGNVFLKMSTLTHSTERFYEWNKLGALIPC